MTAPAESLRASSPDRTLPERLTPVQGRTLFVVDLTSSLLTCAAASVLLSAASAFLVTSAALVLSWSIGRYRVSFARSAREELYAAAAVAAVATPLGVLSSLLFGLSWSAALGSGVAWMLLAGGLAGRLHVVRRGENQYHAKLPDADAAARVNALERTAIRTCDVVFSLAACIVGLPFAAFAAFAIVADDGMPVLFRQTRSGLDGEPFVMLKFRTMRTDAGSAWARPGDDRITRVGSVLRRGSLDELPQLLNVLRGEMSLVGPRPEMHDYAREFARRVPRYALRHRLRPGLTGWAQVRFDRNYQPDRVPEVLAYDLFYVQHYGLHLYLFCLATTAFEVVTHGAV